ncbi:MAG: acetate kinase [bacterium]|nr:acetate kinase [bacterium]
MNILIINAGSSSLKASLFSAKKEPILLSNVHIDGIGKDRCKYTFKSSEKNVGLYEKIPNHSTGTKFALELFLKFNAISKLSEIKAVGHRVVHGGEKYTKAIKIDEKVIKTIEKLCNLAPLHNPVNLEAIKASRKHIPKAKHIAIFDTSFHQTMPEKAYLYGLPYKLYKNEGIRRYGFHGTNHKYVIERTLKLLKTKKAKIVSCHLGNGSSITASIDGKSVDTSMGFTPLEGVIMGTRSGTLDPAITFHLQQNLKMKAKDVDRLLNHESGLLGLSEVSSDMREINEKGKKGDKQARLAMEILSYQIAKYCGAYAVAMKGLDAITFTGGLGEKAFYIRQQVVDYLEFLGFKLDKKKNESPRKSGFVEEEISPKRSKKRIFIIEANEAIQMIKEVSTLL